MEYLLIANETAEDFAQRDQAEYWAGWSSYIQALAESGVMRNAGGLQPPHTATTVRTRARRARRRGRAVRRQQGTARRILRDRRRRSRRGARVGTALPVRGVGVGRSSAAVATDGFLTASYRVGRNRRLPDGRGGARDLLRPSGRVDRPVHPRHRRGRGCRRRSPHRGDGTLAGRRRARSTGGVAPHHGPTQGHRIDPAIGHRAEPCRTPTRSRMNSTNPTRPARFPTAAWSSCTRVPTRRSIARPFTADAADGARTGRRADRIRLRRGTQDDGTTPVPRQVEDPRRRCSVRDPANRSTSLPER